MLLGLPHADEQGGSDKAMRRGVTMMARDQREVTERWWQLSGRNLMSVVQQSKMSSLRLAGREEGRVHKAARSVPCC